MLVLDAVAPAIGAPAAWFFQVPPFAPMRCLGLFAGASLYIGAAGILPEARS